jgi:hypothetical protein
VYFHDERKIGVRWEKKSNFALIVEIHMWLELTWKDLFHTFFFSLMSHDDLKGKKRKRGKEETRGRSQLPIWTVDGAPGTM